MAPEDCQTGQSPVSFTLSSCLRGAADQLVSSGWGTGPFPTLDSGAPSLPSPLSLSWGRFSLPLASLFPLLLGPHSLFPPLCPPAVSLLSLCIVSLCLPLQLNQPPLISPVTDLSCLSSLLIPLLPSLPPLSFILLFFSYHLLSLLAYPLFYFSFPLSIRFSLSFSRSPDVFSSLCFILSGPGLG